MCTFLLRLVRSDLCVILACAQSLPMHSQFCHWSYHKTSSPHHASFAGSCLLLVLADVSSQLKPFFHVRFASIQSVIFMSFFATLYAPVTTYSPVLLSCCASKLHKLPTQMLHVLASASILRVLYVTTTFVGSGHNPSFISPSSCFSGDIIGISRPLHTYMFQL